MLTPDQLETLHRYELGLDRIDDAVQRLNNLGRAVGMPPLAIRCAGSNLINGQLAASSILNKKIQSHYIEAAQIVREERRAA